MPRKHGCSCTCGLYLIKLTILSFQQKVTLCVEESENLIFDESEKLVNPDDDEGSEFYELIPV